jgi:purine-nucleoside phosphorylase
VAGVADAVEPLSDPGYGDEDPFVLAHRAAAVLAARTGVDRFEVLVVLGTALGPVAGLLGAGPGAEAGQGIDLTTVPGFWPHTGPGHRALAHSVRLSGRPVLVVSGRLHLYEGRSPADVVHGVRAAVALGCTTVVLTNAAGGIRADLTPGTVALVSDHLNLTGRSPLEGIAADHPAGSPFVDLTDCWSPRLRALALQVAPGLPQGVYAQMPGPHLETPAEVRMLAGLGADLVGMSSVPEAVAARHLGAEVLGLSVVTNVAVGLADGPTDAAGFAAAAAAAVPEVAAVVRGVVARLDAPVAGSG